MSQDLEHWVKSHAKTEKRASPLEAIPLHVVSVESDPGQASVIGRFQDLGLAAGETIEYFGRAPLGEPIFICVRETVIALRLDEARLISVKP